MSDPLTFVPALIAQIEPGFRLVDGTLLRQLLLIAGQPAEAAAIECGPRLVDATLLRNLAILVGATLARPVFGEPFQDPGKRLIDGTPWKALAMEV